MDFYFDDLPSTSQSISSGREYSARKRENESAAEKSVFMRSDSEEQTSGPVTLSIIGSSVIDEISSKVQDLVEKINNSRAGDQSVMDGFQEELTSKVTQVCHEMKESMYTVYEDHSSDMQVKLKELSKVLESCTQLHQELMDATQALSGLRVTIGIKKQD